MPPTHSDTTASARQAVASLTGHLSHRDRAILRAVARGGAELLVSSSGPDLFLDGRCCCDQAAARALVRAGLITATGAITGPAGFGQRVAARLTATGHQHTIVAVQAAGGPVEIRAGLRAGAR